MDTRDAIADLIYRGQYPCPTSPRIQPLHERGQDEIDRIYATADAIISELLGRFTLTPLD